jgi:hypothetical protein
MNCNPVKWGNVHRVKSNAFSKRKKTFKPKIMFLFRGVPIEADDEISDITGTCLVLYSEGKMTPQALLVLNSDVEVNSDLESRTMEIIVGAGKDGHTDAASKSFNIFVESLNDFKEWVDLLGKAIREEDQEFMVKNPLRPRKESDLVTYEPDTPLTDNGLGSIPMRPLGMPTLSRQSSNISSISDDSTLEEDGHWKWAAVSDYFDVMDDFDDDDEEDGHDSIIHRFFSEDELHSTDDWELAHKVDLDGLKEEHKRICAKHMNLTHQIPLMKVDIFELCNSFDGNKLDGILAIYRGIATILLFLSIYCININY